MYIQAVDGDMGDWICTDTDTSGLDPGSPLDGTCTCWYSGQASVTDVFAKPSGGCSTVVDGADPLTNEDKMVGNMRMRYLLLMLHAKYPLIWRSYSVDVGLLMYVSLVVIHCAVLSGERPDLGRAQSSEFSNTYRAWQSTQLSFLSGPIKLRSMPSALSSTYF